MLIDGTGGDPVPNAVVVIEQGRIMAVGAADTVKIPLHAEQIDLQGAAILPGLINAHIHQGYDEEKLKTWAQGGVTTVRDMAAFTMDGKWFTQRDALNQHATNARLVAVGPFVTVPGGYPIVPWGGAGITVTSPEEAAQETEQLLQKGADLIKIALESGLIFGQTIPQLSLEETTALVKVAHEHGTVVTAHITAIQDLDRAIRAGVDDIAHMVVNGPLPEELIQRIIEADMYWVPTLELWHGVQQDYPGGRAHQIGIENLRKFVQAGGKVALGTDYAGYSSEFDLGMPIREIEFMQAAGMTPMQIIVAATKHAAKVCNLENEIGTLEPGKIADILIVKGDPLEDLHALLDVLFVIHRGEIIRSKENR
jgi:imidazolonepropionase-like amidohydrolase